MYSLPVQIIKDTEWQILFSLLNDTLVINSPGFKQGGTKRILFL